MSSAAIPDQLRALLKDSPYESGTLGLSMTCGKLFTDNKMPFFPAFTDHGIEHVSAVLDATVRLVPDRVWEAGHLTPADAAVLTGACFLHDIGLHVREPGFVALVSDETPFEPLSWFSERQRGRAPDLPWPVLWRDFQKEAQRFSESDLERIFGPGAAVAPAVAFEEGVLDPQPWTEADRLLIGEFLRRHHARLAHEIAIYGFPGLDSKDFQIAAEAIPTLGDAIGVTARSHNESLRTSLEYLEHRMPGDMRPDGALQPYLMSLLRIADFFQIDASRGTPLLMHLREPQSPASVAEWSKHQTIGGVSWDNKDPRAANIRVTASHSLRTHLQLGELIESIQMELDTTTAVLSETYGSSNLSDLHLTLQRVKSNLQAPSLEEQLEFVPMPARTRSAEDLFRLVVGDLYGNEPAVAGRELLQNAVDAVRELTAWIDRHGDANPPACNDIPGDVLVQVQQLNDEAGQLRIVDRGIGMTPTTVAASFLTAGATFREPYDGDPPDVAAAMSWMKTGRFGVGVLGGFLLGKELFVTTRHVSMSKGVSFVATMEDDLVQMNWNENAVCGTEIVVPFRFDHLPVPYQWDEQQETRYSGLLEQIADFYELPWPKVVFQFVSREGRVVDHEFPVNIPDPSGELPPTWRRVEVPKFDATLWSLPTDGYDLSSFVSADIFGGHVAHNGIVIRKVEDDDSEGAYTWRDSKLERLLAHPSLAIFDSHHRLGVALNRYELTERSLEFEDLLLDSIGIDIVAHALVRGAHQHPLGTEWGLKPIFTSDRFFPLMPALVDDYVDEDLAVLWMPRNSESFAAGEFLGHALGSASWDQLPVRTALPYDELFVPDDFDLEDEPVMTDEGMIRATISLGRLLRRNPVAAVWKQPAGKVASLGISNPERRLEKMLMSVGDELSQTEGNLPFGIAVLRRPSRPPQPRQEALAAPWKEAIGHSLPQTESPRLERLADGAVDGPLAAMVDAWRAHSAE